MSTIREKIMVIEPPDPCRWENETEWFGNGFRLARNAAADIAEAEVQWLEARVRELEEVIEPFALAFAERKQQDISDNPEFQAFLDSNTVTPSMSIGDFRKLYNAYKRVIGGE